MTSIATTWGIGGPQFLSLYGVLCAAAAATVWSARRRALGTAARSKDPTPSLGTYKIAMLNGSDQLAITTAATKLHTDGVLRPGLTASTLVVDGELPQQADPLERAVFEAVRDEPGISTSQLRQQLAGSESIGWLRRDLVEVGLLVDEDAAKRLRRLGLAVATEQERTISPLARPQVRRGERAIPRDIARSGRLERRWMLGGRRGRKRPRGRIPRDVRPTAGPTSPEHRQSHRAASEAANTGRAGLIVRSGSVTTARPSSAGGGDGDDDAPAPLRQRDRGDSADELDLDEAEALGELVELSALWSGDPRDPGPGEP